MGDSIGLLQSCCHIRLVLTVQSSVCTTTNHPDVVVALQLMLLTALLSAASIAVLASVTCLLYCHMRKVLLYSQLFVQYCCTVYLTTLRFAANIAGCFSPLQLVLLYCQL